MEKTKRIIVGCIGLALILITGMVTAEEFQNPESQSQESEFTDLNRVVIKIDTLTCGACFSTINSGLVQLEGYSGMGANLFRKLIAVDFSEPLTTEEISEKLIEVGYPGKLESVYEITPKESFVYLESKRTGFGSSGGSCCSTGNAPVEAPQPQVGGSCCTLPGNTTPTQNL